MRTYRISYYGPYDAIDARARTVIVRAADEPFALFVFRSQHPNAERVTIQRVGAYTVC